MITHESLPDFHLPQVIEYTQNNDKTTAEIHSSLNNKPRSKISYAHELKYTGMNVPTPISNEDTIKNNKSFCSQYLQMVLKITSKSFCSQYLQTGLEITNEVNNNNGTFNNIMQLLLHPIIPVHPFIEYHQPEPEPPPFNSYLPLSLFLFIGKTKQKVVLFILKSLTLIKNNNSETLSYINNIITVLTHHVWSSSSFSAPLPDPKFLQIHTNHTHLTYTKTNLFIPEFRFWKCGEV